MTRIPHLLASLLVVMAAAFSISCDRDDNPKVRPDKLMDDMTQKTRRQYITDTYEYRLKKDVKLMSENQKKYLLRLDGGNTLVFGPEMKSHVLPKAGDKFLAIEPTDAAPYGFFGVVRNVSTSGGEVTVTTETASPYDFFEDLLVHTDLPLSEAIVTPASPGVSISEVKSSDSRTLHIPFDMVSDKGSGSKAHMSGTMEITGQVRISFDLYERTAELTPAIGGKVSVNMDVSADAVLEFKDTRQRLARLDFPSPLGALTSSLELSAYFSMDGSLKCTMPYSFVGATAMQVSYRPARYEVLGKDGKQAADVLKSLNMARFITDDMNEAPTDGASPEMQGSMNIGTGLRVTVDANVFGHPLYVMDNAHMDIWGGFRSSDTWKLSPGEAIVNDDHKIMAIQNECAMTEVVSSAASVAESIPLQLFESTLDQAPDEYSAYYVPWKRQSQLSREISVPLDYSSTDRQDAYYMFPAFKDFSFTASDYGTKAVIRARSARLMMVPTRFGLVIRDSRGTLVGGYWCDEPVWRSSQEFTIECDNLLPNVEYRVYPMIGNDPEVSPNIAYSFTIEMVPATVRIDDVADVTENSAVLKGTWEEGEYGEFSQIGFVYSDEYVLPQMGQGTMVSIPAGTAEARVEGLKKGTLYRVRAYGVNRYGYQYSDNCMEFRTDTSDPMQVTDFTVSEISQTSVHLLAEFLENGHEVTDYGFCLSEDSSKADIENAQIRVRETATTVRGLTPDTEYFARAYIQDRKGQTVYSDLKRFTTLPPAPEAVPDYGVLNLFYPGVLSQRPVTIYNTGTATLNISGIRITSKTMSEQALRETFSAEMAVSEIPAGSNAQILVKFSPAKEGDYEANLEISTNDLKKPVVTVRLLGSWK